jgi:hypothetical protein
LYLLVQLLALGRLSVYGAAGIGVFVAGTGVLIIVIAHVVAGGDGAFVSIWLCDRVFVAR